MQQPFVSCPHAPRGGESTLDEIEGMRQMPESRLIKTGLSAASQENCSNLPRFLRSGFLLR